jgi:hypothetical protein
MRFDDRPDDTTRLYVIVTLCSVLTVTVLSLLAVLASR